MIKTLSRRLLRWFGHRRLLPFGIRDRVLRLLVPPDAVRDEPFEVPFFGRRYRGNLGNFLDWVLYFYGAYQPGMLMLLRETARALGPDRLVFIDIGANAGQITLFMSGWARAVHAFEPLPMLVRDIGNRIADNRLDNVVVHAVALGERDEDRTFYPPATHNLGTGTFVAGVGAEARGSPIILPIRNADRYFESHGIGPVNLVKIDTEGFEYFVLAGMARTLARDRPLVVMEWSGATEREFRVQGRTLADMIPARYAVFQLLAPGDRTYRLVPVADAPVEGDVALIPEERVSQIPARGQHVEATIT